MTSDGAAKNVRKAECSECGGIRNCDIQGHFKQRGEDDYFQWSTDWYILQCRGCEHVFVQTVSSNSEDVDYEEDFNGEPHPVYVETEAFWPARSKRKRPEWLSESGISADSSPALDKSLLELYRALDSDLNVLASIGVRTTFDIASEVLGIDPDLPFAKKLDKLVETGKIGNVDRSRLQTLIDAGSASAHRGWQPQARDVSLMMEILEHFIHDAFVSPSRKATLDKEVGMMKSGVPVRTKRTAKAKPAAAKT